MRVPSQEAALPVRVRAALLHGENGWQVIRFCAVGGSSYAMNITTFAVAVELLGLHYLLGAVAAFTAAVLTSFFGHRIVTFRARDEKLASQGLRFIAVYLPAAALAGFLLHLGVSSGLQKVTAQALATACAAPLTFMASKLWSFAPRREGARV